MIFQIVIFIFCVSGLVYFVMALLFFFGLLRKAENSENKKEFVSVVIAARNEEKNIETCLEHLLNQTYSQELYEVIVVDDSSTDSTYEIAHIFSRNHKNFYSYKLTNYVPGYSPKKQALNLGIDKSRGAIILTTDADCKVGPGWIESMNACFNGSTGLVAGFSQVEKDKNHVLLNSIQRFDFFSLMAAAAGSINIGLPFAVSGQNLAYRKKAFRDVNGFNDVMHKISGDDTLLMQLIRKKTGWKIKFNFRTSSFVITKGEKRLVDFINQRKRWASNSKIHISLNKGFFFYLLTVFLFNMSIFAGFFFLVLERSMIRLGALFLLLKFVIDFIVVFRAASLFRLKELLKYYPLWFLFQIPYITYMGFAGTFGKIRWKNREFKI